ncbi:hypothetical protein JQ554_12965 [Bradyrhizobium diazoefficiens]|jgi:hypothetical protein|nr:hypothetical protein [Bradyrhizobium diazoefficiens]MBR0964653.1 hypothetical protein [Bradyrhizobium diazoefficiens]MBR0978826.1 hypothetical protein [Bradyrhizobium diazoefficiens]MBR1006640.1 hypothetical protein [Bradyrhizobium diazoefficiens]MBR1014504.1 hypothetical protein [Bradyrhizobium diazoefficiens]MBR1051821.1 hypothetical protein [Bradyrhizobium diazoefficiens]
MSVALRTRRAAVIGKGANAPGKARPGPRRLGTPGVAVQQMVTRARAIVASSTKGNQVQRSNPSLLREVYRAEKLRLGVCLYRPQRRGTNPTLGVIARP